MLHFLVGLFMLFLGLFLLVVSEDLLSRLKKRMILESVIELALALKSHELL